MIHFFIDTNVFVYLFDETDDRKRSKAEAIVRTLIARGAIGLVTTHDLALAEIVPSLGALAANVHFEDRIDGGTMTFDYRMKPGVVTHSNAVALMKSVGLEV